MLFRSFFAVNADGTVTLFCGKVDLGTGLRIAIPQMAAEELGIAVSRIRLVEGDHDIDCRIDGAAMALKSCFVRKA